MQYGPSVKMYTDHFIKIPAHRGQHQSMANTQKQYIESVQIVRRVKSFIIFLIQAPKQNDG